MDVVVCFNGFIKSGCCEMCILCQLSADVHMSPRGESSVSVEKSSQRNKPFSAQSVVYLPESGQVAHLLSTSQVPKSIIPDGKMLILLNAYILFC